MTIKKIKQIVEIFENSTLTNLEFKGAFSGLKLDKRQGQVVAAQAYQPAAPISQASEKVEKESANNSDKVIDFNNLTEINSPMVGIYYAASSPDAKPFVEKGSKIKKGDTICIIEAMKVMNEILSDYDGEVIDVCAENGKLVEYSQVLFKIKEN